MTNTNTKAAEVAELIDGLDQLRDKLGRRRALREGLGPKKTTQATHRTQLAMTQHEYDTVSATRAAAGLIMGGPVGRSMIVRLGLRLAAAACTEALRDPAAAARLKAKIKASREGREGK